MYFLELVDKKQSVWRIFITFFADASYLPSTWCTIKYLYPLMSWAYMGSVQTTVALTVERFLSLKRLGNRY